MLGAHTFLLAIDFVPIFLLIFFFLQVVHSFFDYLHGWRGAA